VHHRLIRLALYQRSLTGASYASFLLASMARVGIAYSDVVFFNHDRASSNVTAMEILICGEFSKLATSIPCISHALDSVGGCVETETATTFLAHFTTATVKSPKASAIWAGLAKSRPRKTSKVRWWSWYEQAVDVGYPFVCLYVIAIQICWFG
jgi:hypothetical protein